MRTKNLNSMKRMKNSMKRMKNLRKRKNLNLRTENWN
jgi:hypothetical protein